MLMITHSRSLFVCTVLIVLTCIIYSPAVAQAIDLDFEAVMEQALVNSYDVAIAQKNIDISRIYTEEARSLYYPTLTMQAYNQYVDLFSQEDEVVATGDYISPYGESMFQNSLTARVVYLLYDFGVRDLKSDHAEQGVRVSRLKSDHASITARQDMLERYAKALAVSRQLEFQRTICERRRDIYGCVKRLYQAGAVDQTQVEASALELAEAATRIDDLTADFQAALDFLGYYTGQTYTAEDTMLAMLADPGDRIPPGAIDPLSLPEVAALDEEIARKEKEAAIAVKEMLPQFYFDGAFSMYGSIALVAQWEIFSGFGDLAKSRRLKEEAARMNLEKEKRLAELAREIQAASHTYAMYQTGGAHRQERRAGIDKSRIMLDRLARQDIWDQVTLLENDIRLIEHELDMELKNIGKAAAGLKLKFWSQGQRF